MAGNYGKFIDRSPVIRPAGKIFGDPNDTAALCLQEFTLNDKIDALKHGLKIWKENEFLPPRQLPVFQNPNFRGLNTQIKETFPRVKTKYQQLLDDLKETTSNAYWNMEVGKVRDPTPGLPIGMDPLGTTFGKKSVKEESVKELVNPPIEAYEILQSQIGHEMYKKTHNDYNISEKINRNYSQPAFDPNRCYGGKSKYDPRGPGMKRAVNWCPNKPFTHCLKVQSDFIHRTHPQLGQSMSPNNNISCVPEGHKFGVSQIKDKYKVVDLLRDINVKSPYYETSYQASNCDRLSINNYDLLPAGIPSVRHDLSRVLIPDGGCLAEIDNFGDDTSVKAVINPNIYTNYGLNYRDFFMPRSPEMIKLLFEKIGHKFSENDFEQLWTEGLKQDQTGLVCIDTFKNLLKLKPIRKIYIDEKELKIKHNL